MEKKLDKGATIVERNLSLVKSLMQYLITNPQVFDLLPDKFELVILPEDDPEIRLHNLELLDILSKEEKTIVFARVKSGFSALLDTTPPNIYIPVAV